MKSRKNLKKQIRESFNFLYQEVFFYETFTVDANSASAQSLLDKMIEKEDELIRRISVREGKHAKGRVKMYFSKLKEDWTKVVTQFEEEIASLSH